MAEASLALPEASLGWPEAMPRLVCERVTSGSREVTSGARHAAVALTWKEGTSVGGGAVDRLSAGGAVAGAGEGSGCGGCGAGGGGGGGGGGGAGGGGGGGGGEGGGFGLLDFGPRLARLGHWLSF